MLIRKLHVEYQLCRIRLRLEIRIRSAVNSTLDLVIRDWESASLAPSLVLEWMLLSPQFSSVAQSCPTLCDPMDCSTSGFPVHHQLPELTQTHVHWVGDAIQPSHLLSSPSPPAFNLSQHQGLFQWVSLSHQVAKVLEFQLQHQSLQWIFRTDWFDLIAVQRTLKSLLQNHSSKASILRRSAFFIVQLKHSVMRRLR